MKKYRITEIFCLLVLAAFLFALLGGQHRQSDAAAVDVGAAVGAAADVAALEERDPKAFQKAFGVAAKDYDGVYYLASDDVMEVREVLVVRLADGDDGAALMDALDSYVREKTVLFEGYAAEQTALLKAHTLVRRGNFVLFAVCENTAAVQQAFRSAL